MLIFWGTKRAEKKVGYVAEFCPICREIRCFQLDRIVMMKHIYGLGYAEDESLGFAATCTGCPFVRDVDARRYHGVAKQKSLSLDQLIQKTFPTIREFHRDRLAIEERIAKDPKGLGSHEREMMLIDPFRNLAPVVHLRMNSSAKFDKHSRKGCLGTLLIFPVGFVVVGRILKAMNVKDIDWFFLGSLSLFAIGTVYTLIQLGLSRWRFIRQEVEPGLARALHPLNPTREEIEALVSALKTEDLSIGHEISPERLWNSLQKLDPPKLAPRA